MILKCILFSPKYYLLIVPLSQQRVLRGYSYGDSNHPSWCAVPWPSPLPVGHKASSYHQGLTAEMSEITEWLSINYTNCFAFFSLDSQKSVAFNQSFCLSFLRWVGWRLSSLAWQMTSTFWNSTESSSPLVFLLALSYLPFFALPM